MKRDIESRREYRKKKKEKKKQLNSCLIDSDEVSKIAEGGNQGSSDQGILSKEFETEGMVMDIFLHLDDFNDGVLHYDEVMPLLKYFQESKQDADGTEEIFKSKFQEQQVQGMLDFDGFLKFIEQLKLQEQAQAIINDLYIQNFGWTITRCLFGCCKSKFKKMRANKMKERVKNLRGDQQDQAKNSIVDKAKQKATETWQILSQLLQAYGVAADHFSDWYLFNSIYWIGVRPENQFQISYKIVTIVTLMALSSTFLITYSSYVHFLKDSGKFEPAQMAKKSCFGKIKNYMSLTFLGPLIFVVISPLEMMKGLIQLPVYILRGKDGFMSVEFCFQHMIEQLTGLHKLQLKYMVDQRKISQLFFESLPMLVMQILILMNIIPCQEIVKDSMLAILLSLVTAIFSIITNFTQLSFQSRAFREPFSLYALTTLNAKQNWIPFLWQVEKREVDHPINYGALEIPIPGITSKIGLFQKMNFQFSDQTLLYFSNKLSFYQSHRQAQETNQNNDQNVFKPTFTIGKSLELVCINTLLHFIHNFPYQYLNLVVDGVDWNLCIKHSHKRGLIINSNKMRNKSQIMSKMKAAPEPKYLGYTQSNVPLLFVCVENEPKDQQQTWLLEDCLKQLLDNHFDTDIKNRFGELLLSFAIENQKKRSLKILVDYVDLEQSDQRGMSILGQTIISNDIESFDLISSRINGSQFLNNTGIYEPKISLKQISLIQYFCKRCQAYVDGEQEIPQIIIKIYDLMIAREYRMQNPEEFQKFFRSTAKIITIRGVNKNNHKRILEMLSTIASMNSFDLFNYLDKKNRNFGYVFCKYLCGRVDKHPHDLNSSDQLREFSNLFTNLPFEQVRKLVMDQIWEKSEANKQFPYGLKFVDRLINLNTGISEVNLLVGDFLPNKKFQTKQEEDKVLEFQLKMAQDTYTGVFAHVWPELKNNIFNALNEKTSDEVIEYHIEQSKKLTFDQRRQVHQNYGVKFNETQPNKNQLDQELQINSEKDKIDKSKFYSVQIQQAGQQPEFARYIQDIDENEQLQRQLTLSKKIQQFDMQDTQYQQKTSENFIEQMFNLVIELVSTFDLITDLYVLRYFINSRHNMWLAINIFSIVSPLFVCVSPYITFKMEKLYTDVYLNNYFPMYRKIMSLVTFTPFIIVFFFSMDIFFLIFSGIATLIILVIRVLTCGKINNSNFTEGTIDKCFNIIFEMSKLDVAGFRRLRTISQLSFESFIQIILQLRILQYQTTHSSDEEDLGISMNAILVSLGFALLHTVIEIIFLRMEATATKTTLTHYAIVCFNGRFGWVPFSHVFSDPQSATSIEKLDYESIQSQFLCTKFVMDFQFTDSTMAGLTRAICNLPIELDPVKRMTIKIGRSADQVDIMTLLNLVQVAYQRVNIDMIQVNVDQKLKNASKSFKQQLTQIDKNPQDPPLIYRMAQLDCHQMIQKFLNFGATVDFTLSGGRTIIDLAIQNNQPDLLRVLIDHDPQFVNRQFCIIDDDNGQSKLNQYLQKQNYDLLQELCTNPKVSLCHYAQFALMERAITKMREGQTELGYSILSCLYGPDRRISVFAEQATSTPLDLRGYFNQFPEEVSLISNKQMCTISTEMAFKFSLIRRVILNHWINPKISKDQIQKDLTSEYGTQLNPFVFDSYQLDINKLVTVVDLLEGGHNVGNLTKDQVKNLDEFVRAINLDKDQWKYTQQSRLNDQTGYSMSITLQGKKCSSSAKSNRLGKLQSNFGGTGGSKCDDWSYGTSISFKFPQSAISVHSLEAKYHLTDQGWGGTGHVAMMVETYFRNYAQASTVRRVNRQNSEHPNFKDQYDANKIEDQLANRNYSQVDLLGWVSEIEQIKYRPCCPPWGGWQMQSNNFAVSFKVNLNLSCSPQQEKLDYEKLLEEFQTQSAQGQTEINNESDDYGDDYDANDDDESGYDDESGSDDGY